MHKSEQISTYRLNIRGLILGGGAVPPFAIASRPVPGATHSPTQLVLRPLLRDGVVTTTEQCQVREYVESDL
jgi:hypothetical protein